MINILRKEDCCGCGACFDVCAKNAIVWQRDNEGFSYPQVNTDLCVNCGLCNKVCPIENSAFINQSNLSSPVILGAYHKDNFIRVSSTSGGAFWGLAEPWIRSGGYVAGAIFYNHFKVRHIVTNNIEGLKMIKGSKYTQSDCRGMYKDIAALLKRGARVMATGLPCQMAGLRQYLRRDYDNLLLVNVVCHSVTSPMAFEKYILSLENKYNSPIVKYHPKDKGFGGWHNFAFTAEFENGKEYIAHGIDDNYTLLFVGGSNLLTRPSCFECRYKKIPQPTDITIGDLWGIEKFDTDFDSPDGISMIMLNTDKGAQYFRSLNVFESKEYDIDTAIRNNPRNKHMRVSVERPDMEVRKSFVADLDVNDFNVCIDNYLRKKPGLRTRLKKIIKKHI